LEKENAMKDPQVYADAFGRRWDSLDDYREIFDRVLAEVRQATEAADHSDSDWRGPAKARQFWRLAARRAASHAKTVEATAKAYFEYVGVRSRKAL
jgi:hypothetical protein